MREFLGAEIAPDRVTCVYQYMNADQQLRFRYDNTGHHRRLNLLTYLHHKHEGSEENVVASSPADLAIVLAEIESLVQLPS
jgi:hypothetical protein